MSKPYCIVSPDYDYTSGGIKVMWGLYGHLLAKGVEVYMNRRPAKHTIAIYPEITQGNPANGETVVRYILNKPGVMSSNGVSGPTEFETTDNLYYFSRLFGDTNGNHYMFLPVIDLHTFYDQRKKRDKRAVFVGKGQDLGLHKPGAIIINRELAQDQQELANLLNECEVLYCYDPVTAMTEVARLCGCRVVIYPSTYTLSEFGKYEPGLNGISWGTDQGIKLETGLFRFDYMNLKKEFDLKLDLFIEDTQHENN